MVDKKISELPAATGVGASDLFPVTQGYTVPGSGTTRKLTVAQLFTYAGGGVTSVTGTAPVISSGGATPAISIPAATNAAAGYATAAQIAAIEANTLKVTNATHTGDATGATALVVSRINGVALASLATGILRNTTATGVPSIAINADLPVMSATVGGAVPTPPNNITTFLRGDGTFATPAGGGGGDMLLAGVQTNTGLKTFLNASFGLRNVANTSTSFLSTTATAARTWAFQDRDGTLADLGANSFAGSQTITGANALRGSYGGGGVISNFAAGNGALQANTTGSTSTAVGVEALYSNTVGDFNTATGYSALRSNTTGNYNTAYGYNALLTNTIGIRNTANGLQSLEANTTGSDNVASGFYALRNNTTGGTNTAAGANALLTNTTGSNNTASGYNTGVGIITGSGNTVLGANVTGLAAALTNNIILANGTGAIKGQHDGTNWAFTGNVIGSNLSGINTGDQIALTVPNTPAGNIAAITVQAAINELDVEKALLAGSATQAFSATTAAPLTNTTQVATTAFVTAFGSLKLGAQGALPVNVDFNLLVTPGIWYQGVTGGTLANAPAGMTNNSKYILTIFDSGSSSLVQTLYGQDGWLLGKVFTRNLQGATWYSWWSQAPFNVDVVSPGLQGFSFFEKTINESIDGTDGAVGKVDAFKIVHEYGGATAKGGRHGLEVFSRLTSATSATNPDRNYVGAAFIGEALSSDGGTVGTRRGAVFGINPVVSMGATATYFLNAAGMEVNTNITAGSSVDYKAGIQIAGFPTDTVQGTVYDAYLSISSQTGAVGSRTGILFSAANGKHPISSGGALIETVGANTIAYGIKLNTYTFSTAVFSSNDFSISNAGSITMTAANAQLEIGSKSIVGTPFIDFNSSGTGLDYDARILALGGGGTAGNGALHIIATAVHFNRPNVGLELGALGVSNTALIDFHSSATSNDYDFRMLASGGGASSGLGIMTFTGTSMLFTVPDVRLNSIGNYANDAAASAGGVAIGGLYRNASIMQIRVV